MGRLTTSVRGGGCGCKLGRSALAHALASMPGDAHADALAGFDRAEDAAVYRVRDDLAIVASVDFFTPIVDDPETFGAIAATNALSDLHAMGAAPAFALAVAAHPADADPDELAAIMRGAAEAALADGCPILGGHTIDDPEPKYGLAVVGTAHPDRILTNAAGRPEDVLILTKPLGVGVIVTAAKAGRADSGALEAALATMLRSNGAAAAAALECGVTCATDVTGFGLAGHLSELTAASGVGAEVSTSLLPLLPGARALAESGVMTGGARRNRAFEGLALDVADEVPSALEDLLHDPQTSGGLLIAVPPDRVDELVGALDGRSVSHWRIGRLTDDVTGRMAVRP